MPAKPHNLLVNQPTPAHDNELPWNLDLEKCQRGFLSDDLAEVLCDQPTFSDLPLSLQKSHKGWYPPVFHYGFVFNDEKLRQLCATHATTHPKLRPYSSCFTALLRKMMYHGYMQVSAPAGMDGKNDIVDVLSIATNYYPWVEEDTMQRIRGLLVKDLGEPRWFVDPMFAYWKKGVWLDDGIPIKLYKQPFKYYQTFFPPDMFKGRLGITMDQGR